MSVQSPTRTGRHRAEPADGVGPEVLVADAGAAEVPLPDAVGAGGLVADVVGRAALVPDGVAEAALVADVVPGALEIGTQGAARSRVGRDARVAAAHPQDEVTVELGLRSGAAEGGYSRRTTRTLVIIGVGTVLVAAALVARIATAQNIQAVGREDAAALTVALEAAGASSAELADVIEPAATVEADARALADVVRDRANDLAPAAVDGIVLAADALTAALAEAAPEPTVAADVGSPSTLADRYVAADGDERAALRDAVALEVERLGALARTSAERVDQITGLVAAAHDAAAVAVRAGIAAAPATVAANPEATAEVRASFDAAVAALGALGETPTADRATRQALSTYLAAADALRWSHAEAVRAREAAERAAAEQAAAEAAEAAAAADQQEDAPWWQWWGDGRGWGWPGSG